MLLHHRYKILRDLAEGSFGKTFLAEDTQMPTRQRCVIKQLKPINDDRPEVVQLIQERFAREAAVLEAVGQGHSQIPDLLAYFETDGQFYLVQEWIEGTALSDLVQTPWPEEKVFALLASALDALAHIHAQNLIHRDLKPDNIILRQSDQLPCLIDFGAVKELMNTAVVPSESQASSVVIGTLGFMAPEQAVGRPVFSSDLYSLGMTAIYLLTARSPLEIPTDSMNGRLLWNQFAPNVSPRLAGILTRAIHPYPPTRFTSATDMLAVLTEQPKPTVAPATQISSATTAISTPSPQTSVQSSTPTLINAPPSQPSVQPSHESVQPILSVPGNKYYEIAPSGERQKENRSFLLKVGGAVLGSLLLVAVLGGGYAALSSRSSGGEIDASSPEKLESAIARLEETVDARPNNTKAQLQLIEGLVKRGDYAAALSQIDTLQGIADDSETIARSLYWKGAVQITQGDYAEAIATLTEAIEQDDDSAETIALLGAAYRSIGQYDSALSQYQTAMDVDANYAPAYISQASIKEIQGEESAVEDDLATALPLLESTEEIDFYSYRGSFYAGLEETEKAEEDWKKVDALSPRNATDYATKGFTQGLLGDTTAAMDSFAQALEINPNLPDAYILRGAMHWRQGDLDSASADIESALAINPRSVSAYQFKTNIAVSSAEPDIATSIESATQALNINPNHPAMLETRCSGYVLSEQFDKAIADCTKRLETNPNSIDAYTLRGQAYIGQANYESAEKDFTRVIEINETTGKPQTAFVYSGRAVARTSLGDNTGAQADFTEAIALDPEEPIYYQLRGMLSVIAEDNEAAKKDLRKAQDLYKAQGKEDEDLNTVIGSLEQVGIF